MKPAPALVLSAFAALAAAVADVRGAPDTARNVLLIIAGALLAAVILPALARRWPGEQPRPPRLENPHGTQLDDLAQTPDDFARLAARLSPR